MHVEMRSSKGQKDPPITATHYSEQGEEDETVVLEGTAGGEMIIMVG